jgi:hypothetical protein
VTRAKSPAAWTPTPTASKGSELMETVTDDWGFGEFAGERFMWFACPLLIVFPVTPMRAVPEPSEN